MAATSPLARSLLALACFALLVANSSANLENCAENLMGKTTTDSINFNQEPNPYQKKARFRNNDLCLPRGKKLVGTLITACDPMGPPAPSIEVMSIRDHAIICNTDGPCPSGMKIRTSQYCAPL